MNFKRFQSNLIHLNAVDSTNNYAANLLKETNVANGTTILTKRQDLGRGQRGSSWHTEPEKNLILSTIIYPNLNSSHVFYLNIAISLAVEKTLSNFAVDASIKWPNDIYCGQKKIAGILVENQLNGQLIKSAIIGLGLNVNQLDFPTGLKATSMQLETGIEYDLTEVFNIYFENLDFYIDQLMQSNFALLLRLYYQKMHQFEEWQEYADENGQFTGKIRGIDAHGKLRIERVEGIYTYDLKQVRFL